MADQDNLLLEQLKCGDVSACRQLFEKYYKLLAAQAFYLLADEMEAEDCVQNLFIELWNKKVFTNINSSLKSYLQKAIHNKCLNIIQKRKISQRKLNQYVSSLKETAFINLTEAYEADKSLTMILHALPSKQHLAFYLVYLEERKYKDAAAEMQISVNSLKTHLKLAVKGLRKRLIQQETFFYTA